MQLNANIPKFIQRQIFIVNPNKVALTSIHQTEKTFLSLMQLGVGFWKENSNLVIEYVKNSIDQNTIELIEQNKEAIFNYLEINKKYYPLSFSQKMMCVQSELFRNTSYQLTIPFYIHRTLSVDQFKKTLLIIMKRQEVLRTIFPKILHQWVQIIKQEVIPDIHFLDWSALAGYQEQLANLIQNENIQRFNIESGPLFRLHCIKIASQKHLIIFTIHHAIFDGLSFPIFIHELMQAYAGVLLPELTANYAHFVLDQIAISPEIKKKEIMWWKKTLAHCPLQCDLPQDVVEKVKVDRNEVVTHTFNETVQLSFFEFCKKNNISITLFIFSGIYLVLHNFTRQTDIIIGTILNRRNRVEYENLLGDFNNLIPLRVNISEQSNAYDFLKQVQMNFFEGFNHQKIAFNDLVNDLNIKRNKNNLPLYNIFLDSLNFDAFQKNFNKDSIEILTHEDIQPRIQPLMDLFFLIIQQSGRIVLHCAYQHNKLRLETVIYLMDSLENILISIIKNPYQPIKNLYPDVARLNVSRTIFCLPGADGQTDIFSRLTQPLTTEHSFAIKYKELPTITAVAMNVIEVMKSIGLNENSIIIALSSGGIVAFEMIHLLQQQGWQHFPELILLDSPPPNTKTSCHYFDISQKNADDLLLLVINFAIKNFAKEKTAILSENTFKNATADMSQVQKKLYSYHWIKSHTFMLIPSFEEFQLWLNKLMTHLIGMANYVAKPFAANIKVNYISATASTDPFSLLMPNQQTFLTADKKEYWSMLFPQTTIQFYTIPDSDHYSLFLGENIKKITNLIQSIIRPAVDS